ncbi:lipopolysaccharide biosynthesis protein [Stutzerimonas urumqiensis]|uniref:lipopolysaccharide biosynthesis protein n=1 Tax=Stutzerimonas urumqiensis TaxID=638269 RepID=UPI0013CECCEC|nr:oligosaccharide flippase family protein [Stutzerimonas urumqiensis]
MKVKSEKEIAKIVFVFLPMVMQPLLNFFFLVLVAKHCTLEEYGSLALSMVLVSVVIGFSDFGLRDYLLSKGAIDKGLSSGENLFVPATAGYLILVMAAMFYLGNVGGTHDAYYLLLSFLPEALAFAVVQRCLFFHYQRQDRLVRFSSLDSAFKSLPFAVKIGLFLLTDNLLLSVAVGAAVAMVSYLGWFYLRCIRRSDFFAADTQVLATFAKMLKLWRSWLPFTVSFFAFFLYFGADRILIEKLLGAEQLAVYAAATSFIAIGQIAVTAFWSLYMPRISRGFNEIGQRKFVLLAIGLSLGMFVGYQVLALLLFHLFYPESYAGGSLILRIMAGFFIFRLVNVVFEMYWVAQERYANFVKMRVFCGLLSVALNWMFIPVFGLIAPAVIVVVCELTLMLFILIAEYRWKKPSIVEIQPAAVDTAPVAVPADVIPTGTAQSSPST